MIITKKVQYEEKLKKQLTKQLEDENMEEKWGNIKRCIEDAADK